ncbi:MAG: TldD/PmbA family protein, partial [Elusimicrobia bacterium]|nr:TldD/PmbA family protein [Elusimicrobiota bacterium]
MKEGDTSLEEMIKNCGYGLLITQFHYTNCLKPKEVEMTGMTRNGTFLVKDGKIVHAVKNLRFTQSAIEAFKNIEAVGDKAEVFGGYFGKTACPALLVKDFNFSSGTEF